MADRFNSEWTVKLAIISCEYAFDWTVGYMDHFTTAYKSSSAVVRRWH